MLPERRRTVRALLGVCLFTAAVASLVTGIVVYFAVRQDASLSETPFLWAAAGISVYLSSLFVLLGRLVLRKGEYSEIAKRSVIQASATGMSQTGLAALPLQAWGLILGSLIGRTAGLLPMYKSTKHYFGRTSFKEKKEAVKEYWRFPVIFAPSTLLNSFGVQAPVLFVTFWFSVGHAGFLSMAERIIGAPMNMISNAVGQVVDSEVASRLRRGQSNLISFFLSVTLALSVIGIPIGSIFYFFGTYLTTLVLGSQWELAGKCVELMAVTLSLRFIASPTSRVIGLLQRARGMFIIDLCRTVLVLISMYLIVVFDVNFLNSVILFYISLGIIYVVTWFYALRVVILQSRA